MPSPYGFAVAPVARNKFANAEPAVPMTRAPRVRSFRRHVADRLRPTLQADRRNIADGLAYAMAQNARCEAHEGAGRDHRVTGSVPGL